MRNIIFRICPSGSCQYPFVGQLLTLQMKVKITLKIHLGSSTRLWLFQDMSQETWGQFEHAANVQLPILSAFWGDAGDLDLPVGQERNRNIYVHIHPMGSTVMSQTNPNTETEKIVKDTSTLSLSTLSLSQQSCYNVKLPHISQIVFCCKIEIVWLSAVFCRAAYSFVRKVEKTPIPASLSVCNYSHLAVPSQSLVKPVEFFNPHI